jgi:hypothetical protein
MAAPIGNKNAAKSRLFEQALHRAIAQDSGERIRRAAENLLDKAAEGEIWAVQMLADRLDGKPTQQVIGGGENGEFEFNKIVREVIDPSGTQA